MSANKSVTKPIVVKIYGDTSMTKQKQTKTKNHAPNHDTGTLQHRENGTSVIKLNGVYKRVILLKSEHACQGCIAEGNQRLCLQLDACDVKGREKEDFIWQEC